MIHPSMYREIMVGLAIKGVPDGFETVEEFIDYCSNIAELAEKACKEHFKKAGRDE